MAMPRASNVVHVNLLALGIAIGCIGLCDALGLWPRYFAIPIIAGAALAPLVYTYRRFFEFLYDETTSWPRKLTAVVPAALFFGLFHHGSQLFIAAFVAGTRPNTEFLSNFVSGAVVGACISLFARAPRKRKLKAPPAQQLLP
jgi:hypothetical protein